MSDASFESTPTVVHVHANRAVPREAIALLMAFAERAGLTVEPLGDVYSALARIGRDEARSIRAVVVDADELTPCELDFFDVARRLRRDVGLGVYGVARARVARCVALGARLVESEDVLGELIGSTSPADHRATGWHTSGTLMRNPQTTPPPNVQSVSEAPLVPDSATVGVSDPPPVIVAPDEEDVDEAEYDDDSVAEDRSSEGTARVPWLRYEGRPDRAAPARSSQLSERGPSGRGSSSPGRGPVEPLLTDEELRALIGDDLVSLGPERIDHHGEDPEARQESV